MTLRYFSYLTCLIGTLAPLEVVPVIGEVGHAHDATFALVFVMFAALYVDFAAHCLAA